jgi:hypothetical protein
MPTSAVASVLALAGACVPLALAAPVSPSPAPAQNVYVELTTSTVPVGSEVGLRGSCFDNLKPATVSAKPFGEVTMRFESGLLTATARVSEDTRPGDYQVTLNCTDGVDPTATLHVVAAVEPARGPATGGGGTAPGRSTPMLVGGGLAAIAAGLVLAVVSLRRRRMG